MRRAMMRALAAGILAIDTIFDPGLTANDRFPDGCHISA